MQVGLTEAQKARYTDFLGPVIDSNFRQRPTSLTFADDNVMRHLVSFGCWHVPQFLARDMATNPARIRSAPKSLVARGKGLVKVDLDAALPDDAA